MIFQTFTLGDVEDPDLYIECALVDWKKTDKGQWLLEHCRDLTYSIAPDVSLFGQKITIRGSLTPEDEVYYTLKYK